MMAVSRMAMQRPTRLRTAWFLVPYGTKELFPGRQVRTLAIDDYTPAIKAAGGDWAEAEVLGNKAIVKVRATATDLTAIANDLRMDLVLLPVSALSDSLGTCTASQRTAMRTMLIGLGYSAAEVDTTMGADWTVKSLADVCRVALTRRLSPRKDANGNIVMDGAPRSCKSIESVNARV